MNTELTHRGLRLLKLFAAAQERGELLKGQLENEQLLLTEADKKHAECLRQAEHTAQALELLKKAIVPLTNRGIQKLKDLVTFGLSTIFQGCNYGLDIEILERGNDKTAVLWLLEGDSPDQTRVKVRDSIGGGVMTIISLILRVFFIIHYKQRRIQILDEPFGDLHGSYIEGVFKFIRYTISELQFEWLIITHDTRFWQYADLNYSVHGGVVTLKETNVPKLEA